MTPNEKKNFIIQPDDSSDQNVENIIIQPDNTFMSSSGKILTQNLPLCYHPAQ
jgi:hypothetical protein